jgi:Protein of unknown function (DUF3716)
LVTSAPTLKLLQDHYNVSEDDLVNDFKLNDVYMQGAVSFYGTNIMERRVLESWMIQALGEKREVQCKHCEDGRGHYRGCYTLRGLFGGACGNCKRGDRGGDCGLSSASQERSEQEALGEMKNELAAMRRTHRDRTRAVKKGEVAQVQDFQLFELGSDGKGAQTQK